MHTKKEWIKNKRQLSTSPERQHVLDIIEAGFDAIDTEIVIKNSVSLSDDVLTIKGQSFSLEGIENIYIIGFGKASCLASSVLSEILGNSIKEGIAIGLAPVTCEYIHTYGGTHPQPSVQNGELSEKIIELSNKVTDKDLIIVVASGGGSALLCWPIEECHQAHRLYQEFLRTGGDIKELNTIRKHISLLKGGGLAKYLFPGRVVGLIFSDVPGDNFKYVASGPTYKDETTIEDAQAILDKYKLRGYNLNETPKDDKYFSKVTNIEMLSNLDALEAMKEKAVSLGLKAKIISAELYDSTEVVVEKFLQAAEPNCVVLGAGEPKTVVTAAHGTGGRCQRLALEMLPLITNGSVFAAVASDGLDNSALDGVIEDRKTLSKMLALDIDYTDHKIRWDSMGFFEKLGNELIDTGPTQANMSDLIILYTKEIT